MTSARAAGAAAALGLMAWGLAGCGVEEAAFGGGTVVLQEATVGRLAIEPGSAAMEQRPRPVVEGAPVSVRLSGLLPDGCSAVRHVEADRVPGGVALRVWAGRPSGPCETPEPRRFRVRTHLVGLPPGPARVTAGSDGLDLWVVPAPARDEAACAPAPAGPEAAEVTDVSLPVASWPDGQLKLELGIRLPSACLVPTLSTEVLEGRVRVASSVLDCGAQAAGPSCDTPLSAALTLPLPPLPTGRWEIEVDGRVQGTLEVVAESLCRAAELAVEEVWLPVGPVVAGHPLDVRVEGRVEEGCAVPGPAAIEAVGETIEVRLPAAACQACTAPSRPLGLTVPVAAPAPGAWEVRVQGRRLGGLEAVDGAACEAGVPLPPEAVVAVTVVGEAPAAAGTPVDLVVSGAAPGCGPPAADLRVGEDGLDLDLRGLRCGEGCPMERWRTYLSLPDGLPAGTWPVRVDGVVVGSVPVGPSAG